MPKDSSTKARALCKAMPQVFGVQGLALGQAYQGEQGVHRVGNKSSRSCTLVNLQDV